MSEHAIRREGTGWVIYRLDTGKVKSRHVTQEKAEKSLAHIQAGKAKQAIEQYVRGKFQ